MKKFLFCGAVAACFCLASAAQGKLNPASRLQMEKFAAERTELAANGARAAYNPSINLMVTLDSETSVDDLRAAGYNVVAQAGEMAIVATDYEGVEGVTELDCVRYVDLPTQARPLMDQGRALSFVDVCHQGAEGLSQPYKGEGVICGLYDTGLDPNHANFTDHTGNSRVKGVYIVTNYGANISAYLTDQEISTVTTEDRNESHGTHVLGIMAGRNDVQGTYGVKNGAQYSVANGSIPFYGVAPESDIVIGCGDFDTYSIQAGVAQVVARAKELGKPAVVNLSLGHNRGAHDPRESSNKFLDNLAKDAIICVAAGNEGGSQLSIVKTFTGTGANLNLNTFPVPVGSALDYSWYSAEFWSDSELPFECSLVMYNTATGQAVSTKKLTGASGSLTWNATDDNYFKQAYTSNSKVRASWGVDGSTGRYNVQLDCTMQATGSIPVYFAINITGTKGQKCNAYCDAYSGSEVKFSKQGISGYTDGSDKGSINGMACGYNTISVGAWTSRINMPNIGGSGSIYDGSEGGKGVGAIAGFSSYGNSGDGRQLPIVCAPGAQIVSSISKYWAASNSMSDNSMMAISKEGNRDSHWYYMQGTSMACPFAAGTVALWLQACPNMSSADVQNIIATTSTKDSFTSPTTRWGAGKINALEGLKAAIQLSAGVNTTLADDADKNLMVLSKDGKQFEISVPGVEDLTAVLYNMQGAQVATAVASGDNMNLDAAALNDGIYVLTVNAAGQKISRKLVVK